MRRCGRVLWDEVKRAIEAIKIVARGENKKTFRTVA